MFFIKSINKLLKTLFNCSNNCLKFVFLLLQGISLIGNQSMERIKYLVKNDTLRACLVLHQYEQVRVKGRKRIGYVIDSMRRETRRRKSLSEVKENK